MASGRRLGLVDFGKRLLKTGDLDPIYLIANKNTLSESQLRRWLLAYWFFYHSGVASYLSEHRGPQFFSEAHRIAWRAERTPRGTERRHFRGSAALNCIEWFSENYSGAGAAVMHLLENSHSDGRTSPTLNCVSIVSFVKQKWPLFGPWIGFKIADMIDRCLGTPVYFDISSLDFYDSPRKGAKEYCESIGLKWKSPRLERTVQDIYPRFKGYTAPPFHDRPIGVAEIETMLCKWHSYGKGYYNVGKDIREIRHALKSWKLTETSRKLHKLMPKEVEQ